MRTNIVIDDGLLQQAAVISGLKTKKEVVNKALNDFVVYNSRKDITDLKGQIKFSDGYDYKLLREER